MERSCSNVRGFRRAPFAGDMDLFSPLLQRTRFRSVRRGSGIPHRHLVRELSMPLDSTIGLHYRQIAGAFAAAAVYVSNSLLAPRVIARQNLYAKMANETIDTAPSLSRLQATVMDRVVRQR